MSQQDYQIIFFPLGMELFSREEKLWAYISPSNELLSLWNVETLEAVMNRQYPNLFDNWADTSLYLLLLKSSSML